MPFTPLRRAAFALLLAGHLAAATAHEYYAGNFTVMHPWAEATEPKATEAPVYFVLESIIKPDRLLRAYTTHAAQVEIRPGNGGKTATALASVPIAAQDKLEFLPGKTHLLLKGLKAPLEWNRSYPLTLVFEKAGPVTVMVSVGAH